MESDRVCPCGGELHEIGVEVRREIERIELSIVHEIACKKYGCRKCGEGIRTAPGPDRVIERGILGKGFLAHVVTERMVWELRTTTALLPRLGLLRFDLAIALLGRCGAPDFLDQLGVEEVALIRVDITDLWTPLLGRLPEGQAPEELDDLLASTSLAYRRAPATGTPGSRSARRARRTSDPRTRAGRVGHPSDPAQHEVAEPNGQSPRRTSWAYHFVLWDSAKSAKSLTLSHGAAPRMRAIRKQTKPGTRAMTMNTRLLPLLAVLVLCCTVSAQEPKRKEKKPAPTIEVATLGATTRAPTEDEVEKLGLKLEVRARGQILSELTKDGAATKAGLAAGDALVRLGNVEVFSQDDIADFLRVCAPGQKLEAAVLRAKTGKIDTIEIALGAKEVKAPKVAPLAWDYASLANLDAALAEAKKNKRLVLVGLSGAET